MRRQEAGRILKDIGRRVAEIRRSHGLTQERFAEEVLHVSLKYLQAIEAGRENLSVQSLVKLANDGGVPVAALFSPPGSRTVRRGRPLAAPATGSNSRPKTR